MAKKKLDKEAERTPSSPSKILAVFKNETIHFVIGLMLVIFSVYLLLAFSSFFFTGAADQSIIDSGSSADLAAVNNQVKNYAGSRGAQLASYLINDCFGVSSFFILVFLAVAGLKLMRVRVVRLWKWFIGCTLLLVWFSVFFGFAFMDHYQDSFIYLGGMHGYNVSRWLISQVGVPGVWMILLITAICFFIYISARTVIWLRKLFALSFLKREKKEEKENVPEGEGEPEFTTSQPQEVEFNLKRTYKQTPPPAPVMDIQAEEPEDDFPINKPEKEDTSVSDESEGVTMVFEPTVSNPVPIVQEDSLEEAEPGFEVEPAASEEEYQGPELEPYNPTKDLENYRFPTIDLMKHFENDDPTIDMDEQNANKDRIINTLRSFGIEISTIKATVGPTVTLYEITPEQGVRISKIRGLEDDIALSLSADGIRIIAPIPGKGTIGIEVPNQNPEVVSMRGIIASKKFQESKYALPVALGRTISNEPYTFDLAKMPHLLVAGATGQGKSVGLNAIITSLLYKKHPSQLKFVMVDPKKVELSIYSVIEKHFLAKLPDAEEAIITDNDKVVATLNSLCIEMDSRYDLLKQAHVRNIKEYNEKFVKRQLNPNNGHRYLPYIVVVVDEFADLIMTAGKEVEQPIARIAQLARAVGIHMIIATQRPSTNIITGVIKANFPARIAFKVASMIDSRTILDSPGANQLIGRGDMLISKDSEMVRVQCAFVDTPEVDAITKFIADQQGYPEAYALPEYVSDTENGVSSDIDLGVKDPLFEEAARLVVNTQQGSTSSIQRRFSIGYNRAGRIIAQLEAAGIVGPFEGSKARQVLIPDEYSLEHILKTVEF